MADFWLATYDLGPAEGMPLAPGPPKDATGVAVEVMHDGGQYGIPLFLDHGHAGKPHDPCLPDWILQ